MLGKIIQLRDVPLEDGFRVVEGIDFSWLGTANVRFAMLTLGENPCKKNNHITYCWSLTVEKEYDGFKEILVNNLLLSVCKPDEETVEDKLWVIIPYSSKIETTAKKIAGRYLTEAILEMHAGDIVKVNKTGANPEIYMAVQAGNELFLIKKNR